MGNKYYNKITEGPKKKGGNNPPPNTPRPDLEKDPKLKPKPRPLSSIREGSESYNGRRPGPKTPKPNIKLGSMKPKKRKKKER